jgi:hypothetical protein
MFQTSLAAFDTRVVLCHSALKYPFRSYISNFCHSILPFDLAQGGESFDSAQDRESFDLAQDRELVERPVERLAEPFRASDFEFLLPCKMMT